MRYCCCTAIDFHMCRCHVCRPYYSVCIVSMHYSFISFALWIRDQMQTYMRDTVRTCASKGCYVHVLLGMHKFCCTMSNCAGEQVWNGKAGAGHSGAR